MKNTLLLSCIFCVASIANAQERCANKPKLVHYKGEPIEVALNEAGHTRIVFPEEHMVGIDAEVKQGLNIFEADSNLPNRIIFQPSVSEYSSLVFAYGSSGKEYVLSLNTQECSDSQIRIEQFVASDESLQAKQQLDGRDQKTLNAYMYKYIQNGKESALVPEGFRQEIKDGGKGQLVMEVGSLKFFEEEIWHGTSKNGIFIRVENHGRLAQKIDITQMDFDAPGIVKVFGKVKTIAMMPVNLTLAPAAQYTSDLYDSQPSVGYLLAASEK